MARQGTWFPSASVCADVVHMLPCQGHTSCVVTYSDAQAWCRGGAGMAHAQQQVLSRLQLAANPEGGEAIVLRPRSAPTPVATAGTGYQPPQPPPGQPGPPSPSQRGTQEGGWPFAGQGEGRPSGGPSGGTTPRANAAAPAAAGSGGPGDGGSLVGGPGALTPADLVPLAEALQEHERFRVVALQTLQVRASHWTTSLFNFLRLRGGLWVSGSCQHPATRRGLPGRLRATCRHFGSRVSSTALTNAAQASLFGILIVHDSRCV